MPLQPSTTPSHVLTVSQQNYGLTVEENNWDLTLAYAAISVVPNSITSSTTSNGTANLSISNVTTATATVSGTLTANHIHGNLAGSVYAHVRAGETLAKGDPVYVSGFHGSGSTLIAEVSKADASNAAKMPAVGIMDAIVTQHQNGHMVVLGTITDFNTAAYAINAELYVGVGGGMVATPPSDRAQPIARVERSNTNNGAIIVTIGDLSATNATNNTLVRRDATGTAKFSGLAIPSFTSGNVVTVTTAGAFANTSRSGIDSRTSFPNTDVTNATSLAMANRIVKRDGIGDIAVSGLIANTISVGDIDASGYVMAGGFESPAITLTDSVYLDALTYVFGAGADQALKDALGITFSNITDSESGTAYLNLSTLALSEPIVSGLQPKLVFTANPTAVGDGQQILWQWYDGTTATTTASISSEATGSTTDKLIFQTTTGGSLATSLDLTNELATFSGSISSLGESYRATSTFTYASGAATAHRTALGLDTLFNGKANLAGGNTFTGAQTIAGASLTLQNAGAVTLALNDTSNANIPAVNLQQLGTTRGRIEGGVGLTSRLDFSVGIPLSRTMSLNQGGTQNYGVTIGRSSIAGNVAPPTDGLHVQGTVAIGTTTPTAGYTLDVVGAAKISGNILCGGSILYLNSQQALTQGTNSLTLGAATYFTTINYGNASTTVHNFAAGNVGIGTASPAAKFHVSEGVSRFDRSGVVFNITPNYTGLGNVALDVTTNNGIIFRTNNIDRAVISNTGNVGVGTTTPTSSFSRTLQITGDGSSAISLSNTAATKKYSFGLTSTNSLGFYDETASAYRLSILTTGEVGIGTTTPSTKAALDITSTTKGFLPPRMATTQRDVITSVPAGLVIYNTTTNNLNTYNGSAWVELVDSADLGTGIPTFLADPSSENLANALGDTNGTGPFILQDAATLTGPNLEQPIITGPVDITDQDSSTANRVMSRGLSDARVIKNRVEGKARIFSLLNLPTVVAGSVNHSTRPNSVEVLITAANTHSGYVFSELSLHSDWSGAGFNFARNFLCSGVFYLRGLGDQNGALRFYIGAPSSYRSNQASLATAGLCLEFRRNATTLEARLSYFSGTYQETAWVNVYNTGLYYTGVFRFVIRNTGNGNVAVYFLAGTDTGTTKPLPDIDGTPIISITNGPTTSAGANLVTAMCADSSLTPASNTQARIQHFDLELLS